VAVPEFSLVGGGRGIRFVLGLFYVLVWGLSIEYFWSFILAPCYGMISRISDLDEGRNSFLISRPPEGGLFRRFPSQRLRAISSHHNLFDGRLDSYRRLTVP